MDSFRYNDKRQHIIDIFNHIVDARINDVIQAIDKFSPNDVLFKQEVSTHIRQYFNDVFWKTYFQDKYQTLEKKDFLGPL
jgi:hypothetical protein